MRDPEGIDAKLLEYSNGSMDEPAMKEAPLIDHQPTHVQLGFSQQKKDPTCVIYGDPIGINFTDSAWPEEYVSEMIDHMEAALTQKIALLENALARRVEIKKNEAAKKGNAELTCIPAVVQKKKRNEGMGLSEKFIDDTKRNGINKEKFANMKSSLNDIESELEKMKSRLRAFKNQTEAMAERTTQSNKEGNCERQRNGIAELERDEIPEYEKYLTEEKTKDDLTEFEVYKVKGENHDQTRSAEEEKKKADDWIEFIEFLADDKDVVVEGSKARQEQRAVVYFDYGKFKHISKLPEEEEEEESRSDESSEEKDGLEEVYRYLSQKDQQSIMHQSKQNLNADSKEQSRANAQFLEKGAQNRVYRYGLKQEGTAAALDYLSKKQQFSKIPQDTKYSNYDSNIDISEVNREKMESILFKLDSVYGIK